MSLSPQEKLEVLERIGKMPKDDQYQYGAYGKLKADFLRGVKEAEG